VEFYEIQEDQGGASGCVILMQQRELRADAVDDVFAEASYISFVSRGGELLVKQKFIPTGGQGEGAAGSLAHLALNPGRVPARSAAARLVLRRLRWMHMGRVWEAFRVPNPNDPAFANVPLIRDTEEAAVQAAYRIAPRGDRLEGSRGLFFTDPGDQVAIDMPTASYAVILAALGMRFSSQVGKGFAVYKLFNTIRRNGEPLVMAHLLRQSGKSLEDQLQGHGEAGADNFKVRVFTLANSPVWTRTAMVG